MTHLHSVRGGVGGGRPQGGKPQLPAFCRTRRPTTTVYVSSLRDIYRLLLLVLVFQLSTLLLVIVKRHPELALRRHEIWPTLSGLNSGLLTP
jgi:hypothetical protein